MASAEIDVRSNFRVLSSVFLSVVCVVLVSGIGIRLLSLPRALGHPLQQRRALAGYIHKQTRFIADLLLVRVEFESLFILLNHPFDYIPMEVLKMFTAEMLKMRIF